MGEISSKDASDVECKHEFSWKVSWEKINLQMQQWMDDNIKKKQGVDWIRVA